MANPAKRTVGVTADRRGEDQAVMLRRLGCDVVHGPALATRHHADDERLRQVTEDLMASPPDYLVANTGLGMRSWLGLAEQWGLSDRLVAMLGAVRIAARGPKASAAVRRAGLEVWWRAPDERLASIGRRLVDEGVQGTTVALQLHGDDRQELSPTLRAAGAEVVELPVYRWALPADSAPALALIERCCDGTIDAVTFTAGPQVRNLLALARSVGLADELIAACNASVLVACVGPVCAGVAAGEGFDRVVVPDNWRLGALVRLVVDALDERDGVGSR